MVDPLSVAASTIAIVGFAKESCQLLSEFFGAVSGAPSEVRQHITALQGLSSTFAGIQTLSNQMPAQLAWPAEFHTRLRDCLEDFRAMECKIKRLQEGLERGGVRRTWARLKWVSVDHCLQKFLARVQTYYAIFSLDLLTLHMRIDLPRLYLAEVGSGERSRPCPRIDYPPFETGSEKVCPGHSLPLDSSPTDLASLEHEVIQPVEDTARPPWPECPSIRPRATEEIDHMNLQNSVEAPLTSHELGSSSSLLPNSYLTRYLHSRIEPISVRSLTFCQWSAFCTTLNLSLGPLLFQRWSVLNQTAKPIFQAAKSHEGFGVALVLRFPFRRAIFTLYFVRKPQQPASPSLSVRWNLSFPRQVQSDAKIMRLARTCDIEGIRELLQSGKASISDVMPDGTTLLHIATRTSNLQLLQFLIQSGADVNAADEEGETPLHSAVARTQDYSVSRVLIENGADIMNRSVDGRTSLHTFFNTVVATILQYHGNSIEEEVRDKQGMNMMHFVAWSSKSEARLCKQYVERTGDAAAMWVKDNEGRTPLHLAAQRGNVNMVEYLLGLMEMEQLDLNCRDRNGRTPMFYAVESKRSEVIGIIQARGGDVRGRDYRGRTVLHHASVRGNLAAIERLVTLGAAGDIWGTDMEGKTPVDLARKRGSSPVVDFLQELQNSHRKGDDVACDTRSPNLQFGCSRGTERVARSSFPTHQRGCSRVAGGLFFVFLMSLIWLWLRAGEHIAPRGGFAGSHIGEAL